MGRAVTQPGRRALLTTWYCRRTRLKGANDTDHVVEVVGWGVRMAPFWEIRNSWGEYWGEAGFGKVLGASTTR